VSELGELGLSSYEERAYRALLALGSATASEIAGASEVPEGRIYGVLNGLAARGLVETRDGDPRRYDPVDPETAAERLLAERTRELEGERERYRDLAESVGEDLAPTPPTDGNVWTTPLGSDDAVALMRDRLRTVEDRYLVAIGAPFADAPWERYRAEYEAFVAGLEEGLRCRLLLADGVLAGASGEALAAARTAPADVALRRLPDLAVTFDVADGESAYLDVPHPFAADRRFGFVDVTDPAVAGDLERAFESAWSDAEPLG